MRLFVGESNECLKKCGDYTCAVRGKFLEWFCPRCSDTVITDLTGHEPDNLDEALRSVQTYKEDTRC